MSDSIITGANAAGGKDGGIPVPLNAKESKAWNTHLEWIRNFTSDNRLIIELRSANPDEVNAIDAEGVAEYERSGGLEARLATQDKLVAVRTRLGDDSKGKKLQEEANAYLQNMNRSSSGYPRPPEGFGMQPAAAVSPAKPKAAEPKANADGSKGGEPAGDTGDAVRPSDGFGTREYSHADRLAMYPKEIVKIRPNTRGKKYSEADEGIPKIEQEDQRDRIKEGEGFTVTPVFNDVVDSTVRNTVTFDYDGDIDDNPKIIDMIRDFVDNGYMVVRTPSRNGVHIMMQGITEYSKTNQKIPFVDAKGNRVCLEVLGFMNHGIGTGTHVDQDRDKDPMRRPGEPYAVLGGIEKPRIFDADGRTYRDAVKRFCEKLGISEEFDRHYDDQKVQVLDRIETDSSGKKKVKFKDRDKSDETHYRQLPKGERNSGYMSQVMRKISECRRAGHDDESTAAETERFFRPLMTEDGRGGDPWSDGEFEAECVNRMIPNGLEYLNEHNNDGMTSGGGATPQTAETDMWKKNIESEYEDHRKGGNPENTHAPIGRPETVGRPLVYGDVYDEKLGKHVRKVIPPGLHDWIDAIDSVAPCYVLEDESKDTAYTLENMVLVESNKYYKKLIKKSLGREWNLKYADQILSGLKRCRMLRSQDLDAKWWILHFKNGMYDVLEQRFLTAVEACEYPSMIQFSVDYDPDWGKEGRKSLYMEKLTEAMGEKNAIMFLECLGVALTRRRFEGCRHFLFLHGGTHSGKSFLPNTAISAFAGVIDRQRKGEGGRPKIDSRLISAVGMNEIQNNRFSLSRVKGCVNMSSESDSKEMSDTDKLKQITGTDDFIPVEAKNEKGYDTTMTALFIFASNHVKMPKDAGDEAFFDRMILIPCDRKFEPDDALGKRLRLDEDERSGIVWLLVENLKKFIANGERLTHTQPADETMRLCLARGKPEVRFTFEQVRNINSLPEDIMKKYIGLPPPTRDEMRSACRHYLRDKCILKYPTNKNIDYAITTFGNGELIQNRRKKRQIDTDYAGFEGLNTVSSGEYESDYEWKDMVILPWKDMSKIKGGGNNDDDDNNNGKSQKDGNYAFPKDLDPAECEDIR